MPFLLQNMFTIHSITIILHTIYTVLIKLNIDNFYYLSNTYIYKITQTY